MIFRWLKNWLMPPKPSKKKITDGPPAHFNLQPARRAKLVRRNGATYVVPEKPKYIPVLAKGKPPPVSFPLLRPAQVPVLNPDYLSDDFDEAEAIKLDEAEAKKLSEPNEPT